MTTNAAIFSLFGAIIGAWLQYFFTRQVDNQKHRREVRTAAYIDYLKCVSEQANLGRERQSQEGRELAAKIAEAKCRISLYGSSSTVAAFAKFEMLGATISTPEQRLAFTQMIALMRNDSIGGRKIKMEYLEAVLLGAERHASWLLHPGDLRTRPRQKRDAAELQYLGVWR